MASRPSTVAYSPRSRKSPRYTGSRSYLLPRPSISYPPFPSRVSPWTEPSRRRGTASCYITWRNSITQGLFDLLALIPTPSPSRILWGAGADFPPDVVAGPRYEDLPSTNAPPSNSPPQLSVYYYPLAPCHQRRQDESVKYPNLQVLCEFTITAHPHLLTSTPTSHLVHASDADQAEALLTRCGPDGLGKLGGQHPSSRSPFPHHYFTVRLTLGHTHQGSSARGKPGSRDY